MLLVRLAPIEKTMGVSYEQVVKEGEVKRKERKETKEKHLEDIRELFTYKPMLEIMQ